MPGYKTHDTDDLYKKALKESENEHVYFMSDIIALLPCGESTFYERFPSDSVLLENIKEKLTENKIAMKVKLRKMLSQGDKAAEILALYKLIGTQEERQALSQNYTDHTSKGDKMNTESVSINFK
ncbi:hypothetical protein OAT93_01795 [bacterium]|nr:hypothetical protein [bacterium]